MFLSTIPEIYPPIKLTFVLFGCFHLHKQNYLLINHLKYPNYELNSLNKYSTTSNS